MSEIACMRHEVQEVLPEEVRLTTLSTTSG